MHKIAIGLCSFLFLGVVPGPIAAEEMPTTQATPEQFCDYGLVFDDRCEARTTAPGVADEITIPGRVGAANPDEKWVAESASSKSDISSAQR
jgi:hypothetical protein